MVSVLALAWFAIVHRIAHDLVVRVDIRRATRRRVAPPGRHVRVLAVLPAPARRAVASATVVRAQRRRRRHFAHQVPVAVDLVRVAVHAGATPYVALSLAADAAPPLVADALTRVVHQVRLGGSLPDALAAAAARDAPLRPLTEALALAHRLGAPLAPMLARAAADARRELRRRAEARARTVPVRLLFPLVFLVLPAFVVLTVVPALVAGWREL